MSESYSVSIEVAGPLAMFARPDTGAVPTSYPVPTWSAAKGIFESIVFFVEGSAWFNPTRVEMCKDGKNKHLTGVQYQQYTFNYGGPCRKSDTSNLQVFATVLSHVCYRLYATVEGRLITGHNPRHQLYEMFNRRLDRGQCLRTPCLGWREFVCTYWGSGREGTEVDKTINMSIPSMLRSVWSSESNGHYRPSFDQNLKIEQGVLSYLRKGAVC